MKKWVLCPVTHIIDLYKPTKHSATFASAVLLLLMLCSVRAGAEVYQWIGLTANWHDANNWRDSGKQAGVPGTNDIAIFSSAAVGTEVVIQNHVTVKGLYVADARSTHFKSKGNALITVRNGLFLPAHTQLGKGITLLLGDAADNTAFTSFLFDPLFASKVLYTNDSSENSNTYAFDEGLRSCGFFTIVPEVTAPTCNGSNNGIAGIAEPTDGVGPFVYQWIGGPATRLWSGLGAGTYTIIVIDQGQGGLPCSQDIFVNEPGPLAIFNMNGTPPTCFGECNGGATPIVIGGNGGYTLSWSSGEVGPSASALCSTFNLSVIDALGCSFSTDFTFSNAPEPIVLTPDVVNVSCNGSSDASIDLAIAGGAGGYTLSWTGPNSFLSAATIIDNLLPGTYNVEVTDANACVVTASYTITEPALLAATAVSTPNVCFGAAEGSINASATGGTSPYTFIWNGPNGYSNSGASIGGLESGSYALTLSDINGCLFEETYTISEPSAIAIDAVIGQVSCFNQSTGSITPSVSGGTGPYSYAWTSPNGFTSSNLAIVNLPEGSYTLTVTDANDCQGSAVFEINQPDLLEASFTGSQVSCVGNGDGRISGTVLGGVGPYTFTWAGPSGFSSTDQNLAGLQPGDYTLSLTDANGCTLMDVVNVPDAQPISITGTVSPAACATGSTGAIDVTVAGGAEPFIFSWTGPSGFASSDQNIAGLAAGSYALSLTDAEGCTSAASFIVNAPAALSASFTITGNTCFGGNQGSIVTTPGGGTAPYSYVWIGPAGFFSNSQNITDLVSGSYSLQLSDANGCSRFFEATVGQQASVNITRIITNVTCFGGSNGAINITASGGTAPYTYQWTGPNGFAATTEDVSAIAAGSYTVVVTDVNGCEASRTYTVTQPAQIIVAGSVSNVVCAGDADGAITTSISSGAGPFVFSWAGPGGFTASTANIGGLQAGTFTVTATNSAGCQGSTPFVVGESSTISLSANVQNISCFGAADGSIDLSIAGGAEPYALVWLGPDAFSATDANINNLEPGSYNLILTDDFGCEATAAYTVGSPAELAIALNANDISCFGLTDGSINSTTSGGTAPYSFAWSGPNAFAGTTADLADLVAGVYTIVVSDANACSATAEIAVAEPALLEVSIEFTSPSCLSDDGVLTANATGGVVSGAYTYLWTNQFNNPVGSTQSLTGLSTGIFNITVTDDNGCTAQSAIQLLRESINLGASLLPATCADSNDGLISVVPQSGTPPFTYSWTGPDGFASNDPDLTGLAPGEYALQVSDAAGCVLQIAYTVDAPAPLTFNSSVTPESCAGASNGAISLSPMGGTAPYSFVWSGPDEFTFSGTATGGLSAGSYMISLSDANGCLYSEILTIVVDGEITLDFDTTMPACANQASGSIIASVAGAEAPWLLEWSGPENFTSTDPTISNLSEGIYTLVLTDAVGCSAQGEVSLIAPPAIDIEITTFQSTCLEANGSATASGSGGTGLLTYAWTSEGGMPIAAGPVLDGVPAGVYTLDVNDENGCTVQLLASISDANGSVDGTVSAVGCNGGNDGAITVEITDGQQPFVINWTGPNGFTSGDQNIAGLAAGGYGITVTDDNGCIYTAGFAVSEPQPLLFTTNRINATCNGNDGSATVNLSGGTPNFDIVWSGPNGYSSTEFTINDLLVGTYFFSVVDANACTVSGEVEIALTPDIEAVASIQNALCGDENTGSIQLAVSGGNGPYTYLWSGPHAFIANTQNITALQGGDYTVVITDVNGCAVSFDYALSQPEALDIELETTQPDCGNDNGSILALPEGGVNNNGYAISWSNAAGDPLGTTNPLINLGTGVYTILLSDDNGCSTTRSIELSNPGIAVDATVTEIVCQGGANGAISLTITADNPPVEVNWVGDAGFASNDLEITDLAPGTYTYVATAADGCTAAGSFTLNDAPPITAVPQLSLPCFGESNGSITINLSGGTAPYVVDWSDAGGVFAQGNELTDLMPGTYSYAVADANGCSATGQVNLTENSEITIGLAALNPTCFELNNGEITAAVNGGTAPYNYSWSGPDGFNSEATNLESLESGMYTLLITDNNGCETEAAVSITAPDQLIATASIDPINCDELNGPFGISLSATGGTAPYAVNWSGPEGFTGSAFNFSVLINGTYGFTLLDAQGCEADGAVEVVLIDPLGAMADVQQPSCAGATDGAITLQLFGGLGSIDVLWTGPDGFISDNTQIDGLAPGTYTLLLTDSLGCTLTRNWLVSSPAPVAITVVAQNDASCNVSSDGDIAVTIAGGTAPYEIIWTGSEGFEASSTAIDGLPAGTYNATATDANGCSADIALSIDFVLELGANAGPDVSYCEGTDEVLIVGSGEGAESFQWLDAEGNVLAETQILPIPTQIPGLFSYVLETSNGICTTTDTVEVTIFANPDVEAGPGLELFAEQIFVLGGNPSSTTASSFQWSPLAGGNFDASAANPSGFVLESTMFTLIATDANGCSSSDSAFVRIIPSIDISSGFTPNDDGINDRWVIDNIELFPDCLVSVFNRWGQLLYQKRAYNSGNAWDGTFEGKPMPVGTYYFAIELNDTRFPEPFTGPLTIYR